MLFRTSTLAGGTYFFTVDLEDRRSGMLVEHAYNLRSTVRLVRDRHPFDILAWVMLPDHLHAVWTLPEEDADAAMRWALIKARFASFIVPEESASRSRPPSGGADVWQRRYREHLIRDDTDLQRHLDYVHFNPVKHGYVALPSDWPYSSIHRYIRSGALDERWTGDGGKASSRPA